MIRMSGEFIPELGRELSGRLLEIWKGDPLPVGMSAATAQKYRDRWIAKAQPQAALGTTWVESQHCRFEGKQLTGPERQAAGVGHSRVWLHCLHPDKPIGPNVCHCKGCGPSCPGYSTVALESVPIKVINLAKRPDRLEQVMSEIRSAGLTNPVEVIPAADGSRLRPPSRWPAGDGNGAYGCYLSHVRVLVDAINNGTPVWIWEDDALPCPDFATAVAKFWGSLPSDWKGVYFGGEHLKTPLQTTRRGVVRCVDTHRTHCYLVRPDFAKELLHAYESYPGHIDKASKHVQVKYPCYAPDRFLVGQRGESYSDIELHTIREARFW